MEEVERQGDKRDGSRGDTGTRRGGRPSRRHPGPAFGDVLEGEYEWAIDDQPAKGLMSGRDVLRAGRGALHRISGNPGKVKRRILAWVLH